MNRDPRYDGIKSMIEDGKIAEFKQIFTYIPKSVVGNSIHRNNPRVTRLLTRVDDLTVHEIVTMSAAIEIDYTKIADIVFNQYFNDHRKRK